MKLGWILLGTTAVLGGAALGTRVKPHCTVINGRSVVAWVVGDAIAYRYLRWWSPVDWLRWGWDWRST